ncbi:MAG: phosphate/sulfate permease [Maribacter sp.]|jgi:phosphate/sulfate permease
MDNLIIYIGFIITAYSVIANDVIQTLGTFLASNFKRKWWVLWAFAASILTITLWYGWYINSGDVSYGRLSQIPLPETMKWWYLLAPLSLLIITRLGIPVSTTFMILSLFSAGQVIEKMILKSVFGYALAFISSILIYLLIAKKFETSSSLRLVNMKKQKNYWLIAQWFSTGFLWSQWLIQDFANIYVFLPRQLNWQELMMSLGVILIIMAYIFSKRGGKIQGIVKQKSNTAHIRSATIIDLCYGILLYVLGTISSIPMSTTWTFIGILAGREIAINYLLKKDKMEYTYKAILKDFGKVNIGLIVSILIAYLVQLFK